MNYSTSVLKRLKRLKPPHLHRTAGTVYPTAEAGGHYGLPGNRNNRKEIFRRVGAVVLFGLMLCFMMVMSWSGPTTARADGPAMVLLDGTPKPQPDPTPTPHPPAGGVVTSIQKIIHNLKFDSSKISEALSKVFTSAAENSEEERVAELQTWNGVLSQLVQSPIANAYAAIARSSLKVAGSLAIALFILRLAMYQWNKLLGSEDSPLQVLGDWLTAGVLAVASGPFLDLIVRLGWWTMAAVLGETGTLARTFIQSMAAPSFSSVIVSTVPGGMIIQAILSIALGIGSLLALAAMLFAFGVAQATLYSLAAIGPSVAVASVIPEMKWLRSLWIKGAVLVALMPIMAGGIFKAGIGVAASTVSLGGMMSGVFRVLWLFGAAGLLLSVTGILFRITLGAAGEAVQKMWDVAKGIAGTVALVGAAVATGGAAGIGAGAGAGATATTVGTGTGTGEALAAGGNGGGLGGGGTGGLNSAMGSLDKASTMNTMSNMFQSMGLPQHSRVASGLARGYELDARRADLATRISNFGGGGVNNNNNQGSSLGVDGLSSRAAEKMLEGFGGSADELKQVFPTIGTKLEHAGFPSVSAAANQYPRELGQMARLYQADPDRYNSAPFSLELLPSCRFRMTVYTLPL